MCAGLKARKAFIDRKFQPRYRNKQIELALIRELPGLIVLGAHFLLVPWVLKVTLFRKMRAQMGQGRYVIMMVLFMAMALVPIKMLLHRMFEIKYIVALGEWCLNI